MLQKHWTPVFTGVTSFYESIKFGPPEYFAVILAGLTMITYLTRGSMLKGWIMILLGFILGGVGRELSGMISFRHPKSL